MCSLELALPLQSRERLIVQFCFTSCKKYYTEFLDKPSNSFSYEPLTWEQDIQIYLLWIVMAKKKSDF